MRAHKVNVKVTDDHEVKVTLPRDFPAGDAEVIVLHRSANEVKRLTVDELLSGRLVRPSGVAPVSLADMERAIVAGSLGLEVV